MAGRLNECAHLAHCFERNALKSKSIFDDIYRRYNREFPDNDIVELRHQRIIRDSGFCKTLQPQRVGCSTFGKLDHHKSKPESPPYTALESSVGSPESEKSFFSVSCSRWAPNIDEENEPSDAETLTSDSEDDDSWEDEGEEEVAQSASDDTDTGADFYISEPVLEEDGRWLTITNQDQPTRHASYYSPKKKTKITDSSLSPNGIMHKNSMQEDHDEPDCSSETVTPRLSSTYTDTVLRRERISPECGTYTDSKAQQSVRDRIGPPRRVRLVQLFSPVKNTKDGFPNKESAFGFHSNDSALGFRSKDSPIGLKSKESALGFKSKETGYAFISKASPHGLSSENKAHGFSSKTSPRGFSSKTSPHGLSSKYTAHGFSRKASPHGFTSTDSPLGVSSNKSGLNFTRNRRPDVHSDTHCPPQPAIIVSDSEDEEESSPMKPGLLESAVEVTSPRLSLFSAGTDRVDDDWNRSRPADIVHIDPSPGVNSARGKVSSFGDMGRKLVRNGEDRQASPLLFHSSPRKDHPMEKTFTVSSSPNKHKDYGRVPILNPDVIYDEPEDDDTSFENKDNAEQKQIGIKWIFEQQHLTETWREKTQPVTLTMNPYSATDAMKTVSQLLELSGCETREAHVTSPLISSDVWSRSKSKESCSKDDRSLETGDVPHDRDSSLIRINQKLDGLDLSSVNSPTSTPDKRAAPCTCRETRQPCTQPDADSFPSPFEKGKTPTLDELRKEIAYLSSKLTPNKPNVKTVSAPHHEQMETSLCERKQKTDILFSDINSPVFSGTVDVSSKSESHVVEETLKAETTPVKMNTQVDKTYLVPNKTDQKTESDSVFVSNGHGPISPSINITTSPLQTEQASKSKRKFCPLYKPFSSEEMEQVLEMNTSDSVVNFLKDISMKSERHSSGKTETCRKELFSSPNRASRAEPIHTKLSFNVQMSGDEPCDKLSRRNSLNVEQNVKSNTVVGLPDTRPQREISREPSSQIMCAYSSRKSNTQSPRLTDCISSRDKQQSPFGNTVQNLPQDPRYSDWDFQNSLGQTAKQTITSGCLPVANNLSDKACSQETDNTESAKRLERPTDFPKLFSGESLFNSDSLGETRKAFMVPQRCKTDLLQPSVLSPSAAEVKRLPRQGPACSETGGQKTLPTDSPLVLLNKMDGLNRTLKPKASPQKEIDCLQSTPKANPMQERDYLHRTPKASPRPERDYLHSTPGASPRQEKYYLQRTTGASPRPQTDLIDRSPRASPRTEKVVNNKTKENTGYSPRISSWSKMNNRSYDDNLEDKQSTSVSPTHGKQTDSEKVTCENTGLDIGPGSVRRKIYATRAQAADGQIVGIVSPLQPHRNSSSKMIRISSPQAKTILANKIYSFNSTSTSCKRNFNISDLDNMTVSMTSETNSSNPSQKRRKLNTVRGTSTPTKPATVARFRFNMDESLSTIIGEEDELNNTVQSSDSCVLEDPHTCSEEEDEVTLIPE